MPGPPTNTSSAPRARDVLANGGDACLGDGWILRDRIKPGDGRSDGKSLAVPFAVRPLSVYRGPVAACFHVQQGPARPVRPRCGETAA